MARILPEPYKTGYISVLKPRKGTSGVGSNNQVKVWVKDPDYVPPASGQ